MATAKPPTSYDIAKGLVARLGGDPNNKAIVRAVAIWLAYENRSIKGNNPWNIRGTGPCGAHYFGSNGPFKTYCTLNQGLDGTATLLKSRSYYRPIVAAVAANDPNRFFLALAKSPWSGSHYGGGGKLISAYGSSRSYLWTPIYTMGMPGPAVTATSSYHYPTTPPLSNTTTLDDFLKTIGRKPTDPIRQQDIDAFVKYLQANGLVTKGDKTNPEVAIVYKQLETRVGSPWTSVGSYLASEHQNTDPLTAIANVVTAAANPKTWVRVAAILAGAIVLFFGAKVMLTDAFDESPAGAPPIISPIPIILREGSV